ncbi:MAG: hypothetical protein PHH54_04845 [Candidatus Nanoarchaeia archaeon]|nr:hypothetical protein [Candidatus Nanoarchaeia archaeon]MDD5741285.1 hypothetical protein [Candidatus Nanoarchaeia archaeon]
MTFEILMPEIDNNPKNTKDAVISMLVTEWPLTLRNIFYRIKKQYGYSATYQSVYKAVKELCDKKVLIEKDKKYEINVGWIKKVQSFTDIVETNYYAKQKLQNFSGVKESKSGDNLIILNFETVFDAEKYLYYFMKTELFKKKNDKVCFQLTNEWRPLYYLRAEYNYYKRLIKRGHKFYFVCSGQSEIEKQARDFYNSIKINYKIINENFPNDTLIFQDFFIQIFIPEQLKIKMQKYLKGNNKLELLKEVLEMNSSIRVVINKDKDLADEVRKQIIKKFV